MKENFTSFCMLSVFKNSLRYVFMVQNVCPLVNLVLGALSPEFHSTSSTSESPLTKAQWEKSEQKTKIMETVKLEGEKEIKEACIKLYGKLL